MAVKPTNTVVNLDLLFKEAVSFAANLEKQDHPDIAGQDNGKTIGTYIENKFKQFIHSNFGIEIGNASSGLDIPDKRLLTDIKTTFKKQPQSSCPYDNTRQKIYGLGYNLLLFVYEKTDIGNTSYLKFANVALIKAERTGDFNLTGQLRDAVDRGSNVQDILAIFEDRNLPGDSITLTALAEEVLKNKPEQGYLTISNAFQWRLQYGHIVELSSKVRGIEKYDF